jgi:hypothetical protein
MRDPRQLRDELRGLDGGPRLLAALDAVRRHAPSRELVVVNNGRRGPMIFDTRGITGEWVIEELLPTGVIAALADLDDPSPATLLENGFDVVLHFAAAGAMDERPVLLTVHWRDGLVPGVEPPAPFWVRFDPTRLEFGRVDVEPEAE